MELMDNAVAQGTSTNAIFSFIKQERLTISSLIKRYGEIKRAALVAVFKAIYKANIEILVYTEEGIECGLGLRGYTEHNVQQFHFLDLRGATPVVSVFALRETLLRVIESIDIPASARELLRDPEMCKFFDNKMAKEEFTVWRGRLSDVLLSINRIIATYRTHGLKVKSYSERENFTLQDILNIAAREGLMNEEEELVNNGLHPEWAALQEPDPIPEQPRPDTYVLSNGVELRLDALAEAARIYQGIKEETSLRARLGSGDFDDRIFDFVPQRELALIIEELHMVKRQSPELRGQPALDAAIMSWWHKAYNQVLTQFYIKYQENFFAGTVLSKDEFAAGVSDITADVFHSRAMAIRYLGPEDYWRWRLLVKERIPGEVMADITLNNTEEDGVFFGPTGI